jgi:hypothetical protein
LNGRPARTRPPTRRPGEAGPEAGSVENRDANQLLELSRADRIVCADVATEYFPACRSHDVLRGYGSGGPDFVIEMLDEDAYHQLEAILGAIDPTSADELGEGEIRFLGVGTCGPRHPQPPDVPRGVDRRGQRARRSGRTPAVEFRAHVRRRRVADRVVVPRSAPQMGGRDDRPPGERLLRGGPVALGLTSDQTVYRAACTSEGIERTRSAREGRT